MFQSIAVITLPILQMSHLGLMRASKFKFATDVFDCGPGGLLQLPYSMVRHDDSVSFHVSHAENLKLLFLRGALACFVGNGILRP